VRNPLRRLSLRTILTIPNVLQTLVVVGIVGYLSFRNGQSAVNNLAFQLRTELTARILKQLEVMVEQPYVINKINGSSLLENEIDLNKTAHARQFWQQINVFPLTNLIYCATEADGAFLGAGRSEGGVGDTLQIVVANRSTNRFMHYYKVDPFGRPLLLVEKSEKSYDPRLRPWYQMAKLKGKPTWSDVYLDFDALVPVITANTPIYDPQSGQLLGVCATDIILSEELNKFLQGLKIGKSGIAFIMEPSGFLIASSTPEPITVGSGSETTLLAATASSNPLIQKVARYLADTYRDLDQLKTQHLSVHLADQLLYVEVVNFADDYGLDWRVVLAIPKRDFMQTINQNTQTTILLIIFALIVAIFIGFVITHWLTKPLVQLQATAQRLAQGDWDQEIALDRADAIGDLSRSFATMAQQLKAAFSDLEKRIEERTVELVRLNQELQQLAQTDGLTKVANRRYFDAYLAEQWQRLGREGQPLALILCDADHFKQYNDIYGHQAGDFCLQRLAEIFSRAGSRPGDLVARYGGEEFVVILPNTDIKGAIYVATRIRTNLQVAAIPHQVTESKQVTVSMGIAALIPSQEHHPKDLIDAADHALYTAKAQGRDCYCVGEVAARS